MRADRDFELEQKRGFWNRAFTLIDLLVAIAILSILVLMLVSALAKSSDRAGRITCFNNKRQMQAACAMYSAEWNDWLVANAPVGNTNTWCYGAEGWGPVSANTNADYYTNNSIWPYVKDLNPYKCPNDKIPSDNGDRIRSISMNGYFLGDLDANTSTLLQAYSVAYRFYSKTTDLTVPGPSKTWVFCDESMYSLNDGYFSLDLNDTDFPDVPAAYDGGGNCFSFADGHVEYRKWVYFTANPAAGILKCPYAYGITGTHWGTSGLDVDWKWWRAHSSALRN